jgi:hypothetical protein
MLNQWQHKFPGCEPVSYRLRSEFPSRWVRFHSLPESKRYPEDEQEFLTLLSRHNRVLRELIDWYPHCVLLTTGYSDSPDPVRSYDVYNSLDPTARPWRTLAMHELEGDDLESPNFWHVFSSEWGWKVGQFDAILRLVAVDEIANVMIVASDCSWLLHPYDGGMDVILESTAARDRLKALFTHWLSSHPFGL